MRAAAGLFVAALAAVCGAAAPAADCVHCSGYKDAECMAKNMTLFNKCNCGGGGCDCSGCCAGAAVATCCGYGPTAPGCSPQPPPPPATPVPSADCVTCSQFKDAVCFQKNYTIFSECNCGGGGCDCVSCCTGSAKTMCCSIVQHAPGCGNSSSKV
eukprot:TRINITY_DN3330_c0_g1_i1.p1 TRINITY_DN3330_c0_g1~~TRINITY_DN3330_c0_g1_i1.p1  ORF type:complete len:156 (+),score=55.64 TRINITY_DN3330_c0_g1_i1:75-542(+)